MKTKDIWFAIRDLGEKAYALEIHAIVGYDKKLRCGIHTRVFIKNPFVKNEYFESPRSAREFIKKISKASNKKAGVYYSS